MTEIIDKQVAPINSEECRNTSGLNDKGLPCAVVRDLLPLYHDGVVSEETTGLIEAHLEGCEDCREELKSIQSDEQIEANLIEQDKETMFYDFRGAVRDIRNSGIVRGLLIAAASAAVFFGGIAFLNNADIVKVGQDDLQIADVCRYDFDDNRGDGIYFTFQMAWSGGWSVTYPDKGDPTRLDIEIKRTLLGGEMEMSNDARHRTWEIINKDQCEHDFDKLETIAVNGQVIWTKEQGIEKDPPEYIGELIKENEDDSGVVESRVDGRSVSITYSDGRGVKWDKGGKVIATYTVNEDGNITSMTEVLTDADGPVQIVTDGE